MFGKKTTTNQLSDMEKLLNSLAEAVVVLDWKGKIIFANQALARLAGYKKEKDLIGKSGLSFIHPDSKAEIIKDLFRTKTFGGGYVKEYKMIDKDGNIKWAESIGDKVLFNGKERIITSLRDITEQKRLKKLIQENKDKLDSIVNTVPHGIAEIDLNGNFTFVNKAYENIFGYKPEYLIGKNIKIFMPDKKAQQEIGELLKKLAKSKTKPSPWFGENKIKSGKILNVKVDWNYKLNKNNDIIGFVTIVSDITKQKEEEEKFKNIIESSYEVFFTSDLHGKITYISPAVKKITGYKPEELIGTSYIKHYPTASLLKLRQGLKNIQKGRPVSSIELKMKAKSGKLLDIEISAVPVKRNGRIIGLQGSYRDISEQKKFKKESGLFKNVFDLANFGMGIADTKGKLIYVNAYFAEIHGYKTDELIGKNISVFHTKEQMKDVAEINKKAFQQGGLNAREIGHKHKNGSTFPMLMNIIGIKDKNNNPLYVAATAIDIRERKDAQKKLIESRQRLKAITDNIFESIIIFDFKGKILYANKSALGLVNEKSYEDKNIFDFVHPESRARAVKDALKVAMGKGGFLAEYRINAKKETWVESLGKTIDYEGKKANLNVLRNITEKRQSEFKYKLVTENSGDVIYVLDLKKNKYTYVTPSVEKMLGYTPEEAMELNPEKILTPESFEIQINAMRQALKNKKRSLENPQALELEAVKKDGSTLWVDVNAKFLLDKQGRPYAILGVSRDINERKKAEEKLKKSERNFRLIAENTGDLISVATFSLIPKYTYIAPSIKNILGYEPEELVGKNGLPYVHPDDRKIFISLLKKYLSYKASGKLNKKNIEQFEEYLEYRFRDKKGDWHNLESTINLTENGELLLVSRDVTEKKKAEKALRKEHEKMITLFNSVEDAIYVADTDTYEILFVNKFMEKAFGKKLVGKICYKELQGLDKPCRFCTNKKIKALKGESYRWKHYNPVAKRYYDITDKLLDWPDGRKVRFEIARDITDKKESEKKFKIQRDFALNLNKSDSIEKMAEILFQNIVILGEVDAGGLYVQEANGLMLKHSSGLSQEFVQQASFYSKSSPQYQLIAQGKEVFTDYKKLPTSKDPIKQSEKIKIIGILPLKNGKEVLGAINVASHTHANFSEQTKNFLKIISGQIQQIILRLKKEEELRESEKRHRIVTEKTGNLVYDYDVASGEIKWFGAIKKTTGYSPEEFADFDIHSWEEMIHPDDREDVLEKLEKAKDSIGKYNVEYRMRQKNGKYSFVEEYGVFIANGNKKAIRMFGAVKDITDKKTSENKLKDSESRYRLLSEASAEGIVVVDTKGKFKYANPAFEDLSGYSRKELLKYTYKKLFSENSIKKAEANFGKMMMGEVWTTKNNEYRLKTKDGNLRDIEISSSVIKKDGKIDGLMSVIRDISNKKKFEEQLKDKVRELEEINRLMVGRELKMVELKKKVEELENKLSS